MKKILQNAFYALKNQSRLLLAAVVGFIASTLPAYAVNIPTMQAPSRGNGSGIWDTITNYFADGITLVGGVIVAIVFIVVASVLVGIYRDVAASKKTWGELGMYAIVGVIVIIVVIWLAIEGGKVL